MKKKKNFSKRWPKRLTSNGVFSKRERENPFPAAKEDDALKLPWNQKERILYIFDSYCMLEILLLFWADTCVSMFPRFFSGLHLHKTYMRSSVIVELCQGWLISKAIDGIRKS